MALKTPNTNGYVNLFHFSIDKQNACVSFIKHEELIISDFNLVPHELITNLENSSFLIQEYIEDERFVFKIEIPTYNYAERFLVWMDMTPELETNFSWVYSYVD